MFSHRSVLKNAWKNTLKYKYLWLFGFFATLTAAGGTWEYNLLNQGFNQNIIIGSYAQLEKMIYLYQTITNFAGGVLSLFQNGFWNFLNGLTILIISALLLAIIVWLAISSQGALINALKKILTNKKETKISYRENITVGHKNFWQILGMNLLIVFFIYFSFFIISLPLLILVLKDIYLLGLIYIVLFVLFVPISTGFALMMKYAISYQIFEELGFKKSIQKGYELFKKNWLISLEMAVILFIISFLAGLIFSLFISIFIVPLFITSLALSATWVSLLITTIGIILVIIFGTILSTFQISVWTQLFYELKNNDGILAKLERLIKR